MLAGELDDEPERDLVKQLVSREDDDLADAIRAELPDRADAPADETPAQEHAKRRCVHGVVVCAAGQLNPSVFRVDAEEQPLISVI